MGADGLALLTITPYNSSPIQIQGDEREFKKPI